MSSFAHHRINHLLIPICLLALQGCAIVGARNQLDPGKPEAGYCVHTEVDASGPASRKALFPRRANETWVSWRFVFTALSPADSIRIDSIRLGETRYDSTRLKQYVAASVPPRLVVDLRDSSATLGEQALAIHGTAHLRNGRTCAIEETRKVDLRLEKWMGLESLQ